MNKKQILKEQKRIKQERRESEKMFRDDNGIANTFKITLGVLLFIGILFVTINVARGNWNLFNKNNRAATEINPDMVIAGTMFNKEEDSEYIVLAYDMQGTEKDLYSYMAQSYSGTMSIYYLDLSSGFNDKFIGETPNITNDLSTLKFGGPTLLVVKNDQIVSSYVTEEDITNYLSSK